MVDILLSIAVRNLRRKRARTFLASVGITIGVAAIALIGILGTGMQLSVESQFIDMVNEINITPDLKAGVSHITEDQLSDIERMVGTDGDVIPTYNDRHDVEVKGERTNLTVIAIPVELTSSMFDLQQGSNLRRNKDQCLAGYEVYEDLEIRAGSTIHLSGEAIKIVGILKEDQDASILRTNDGIVLSKETYERLFNPDGYTSILVKVNRMGDIERVEEMIDLKMNRHDDTVNVMAMKDLLSRISGMLSTITGFLAAIGAISLLVAGIGILNVMLMSVTERTKDVGIMRSVGAYRKEMMKMFMYEALIIGIFSVAVAVVISILGGYAMSTMMSSMGMGMGMSSTGAGLSPIGMVFSPRSISYILIGVFFGIFTTLISGLVPAFRASNMDPIKALRYE